ncbi:(2Fe-2S)-binding protein [Streptomyces cinnamoneus]|uniref:(2Fe-2S)-binding protein n=1 Tax=Streptomyces cinnamoneus TaxID=53446 RepID=UPI0037A6D055
MSDEQHHHHTAHAPGAGGWQPIPRGGELDAEGTTFVQLPPELLAHPGPGAAASWGPLAAPGTGSGYAPAAEPTPAPAPASFPGPFPESFPEPAHQPAHPPVHQQVHQEFHEPVAAAGGQAHPQWGAVPQTAAYDQVPTGDGGGAANPADPQATAEWAMPFAAADAGGGAGAATGEGSDAGQWSVPAAGDDSVEESGEYALRGAGPGGVAGTGDYPTGAWTHGTGNDPRPEHGQPGLELVAEDLDLADQSEPAEPAERPETFGEEGGAAPETAAEPGSEPEPALAPASGPASVSAPASEPAPGLELASEPVAEPVAEPVSGGAPEAPSEVPSGVESEAALSEGVADPVPDAGPGVTGPGFTDPGFSGPEPEAEALPAHPHNEHPCASYVLRVNGTDRPVTDAWIGESLLYVLRERLGLAGAKDGCSQGECGACSVQVDGRLVASCLVPAATTAGAEIRTVEGLAADGRPSDVQRALAACGAVQCGFCVPGLAMTVHDLLEGNHAPTELEARQAICGNLCRCSGYRGVLDAVRQVVDERAATAAAEEEAAEAAEAAQARQPGGDTARIPHQTGPHGNPGGFGDSLGDGASEGPAGGYGDGFGGGFDGGTFDGGTLGGGFEAGNFDTGSFEAGGFETGGFETGTFETGNFDTGGFSTGTFETGTFDTGGFEGDGFDGGGFDDGSGRASA